MLAAYHSAKAANPQAKVLGFNTTDGDKGRDWTEGVNDYFGESSDCRVLTTEEGYLEPSGAAHSAMAWLIEDTHFKRSLELAQGVQAYVFEGKGRSVAVLMPAREHG